jgi:hypothetical protein
MGFCLTIISALAMTTGSLDTCMNTSTVQRVTQVANLAKGAFLACVIKQGMTPEQVRKILGSDFEVSGDCKCWDYSCGVTLTFSQRSIIGEPDVKVVSVHWQGPWYVREPVDVRQIRDEWERIWRDTSNSPKK